MRLRASEDAVSREVSGESVILNLATGSYFGLNEVGTRIWNLILKQETRDSIIETLLQEYESTREQVTADVDVILRQLSDKGLTRQDA